MRKLIFIVVVTLGLFGNFSCKTKDAAQECSKCHPLPPDKIVNIQIANIDKTFKVWIGGGDENAINSSYSVAIESQSSNRSEMSDILEFYKINAGDLIKDYELTSIVLYSTGAVDAKTLEKNNVLGAIVYTSTPDRIYIHVFKNEGSEMKLIDELSSETRAITYDDIYLISSVFGMQPNIVAWQTGDFKVHYSRKKSNRNIEHKLNKYLNVSYFNTDRNTKNILGLEQSLHSARGSCGRPCRGGKGTCVVPDGGDPFCYPGDEPMCAVATMQQYNNYGWDNDPRHPFLYDFRDNVLGTSAIGEHIKEDFYYCGAIISGKITSTQAMNGFSLIDNHILPIVKRLNSPSATSDSSVILGKSERDDINAFVADIKTLSTDQTFEEILDEVVTNVNYCEGKTVAQIKYELTH